MSNFIKLIKNTSIVGLGTMISRTTGYVREFFLAAWMGTSPATDALIVATKIPTLLRKLTSEGPLHGALIPLLHDLEKKNEKQIIASLINIIIVIFCAALTILCILQIYFAKNTLHVLAPGFLKTPERLHWFLTYIAFSSFSTIFFFLYGMFSTLLNYHKKFFIPAIAPVFWNLSLITCMGLAIRYNLDYSAFGIFFFIASGIQMLSTLIPYLKLNIKFEIKNNQETRNILRMFFAKFFPVMFSTSVMHVNGLIITIIGSLLPAGNMTYLHRTEKLLQVPFGILLAITTTMLPTLTQIIDKRNELKKTIRSYMLISVSICIPIVLTCFFAAEPIVKLVFNYGSCTQKDILSIVSLLKIYSFEILAFFLIRTIAIVFFAKKETRITTIGACIHTSLNIVLSIVFLKYNAQGIAYASVISSWVHLSWLSINIIKAKYI